MSQMPNIERYIEYYEKELQELCKRYEQISLQVYGTKRLRDRAEFAFCDIERSRKEADEYLKEIHLNFEKCLALSFHGNSKRAEKSELDKLLKERDTLKQQLTELQNTAEKNARKLNEVNKMIEKQEEENAALVRRLTEVADNTCISQDIKEKIDRLLKKLS